MEHVMMMQTMLDPPDRLMTLLGWLAQGWEIEAPVLQRVAVHGRTGAICAFEVVVRRANERRVIALRDERAVERWLEQAQIDVLYI